MTVQVRLAGPDDIPAMAVALGRAFADDPIFEYLVPEVPLDVRAKRATPFFVVDTRIRVRSASAWTTPEHTGGALWAPPGKWRTTLADTLRLAWPILRGSRGRALKAFSALSAIEKVHPRQPHWYLAVLGTDPDHQGKGIGSALMGPVLTRCDVEGIPAYLESSKESNIGYYERFGFTVERELALGKGAPTVWPMWREPQVPDD
jgi:ribosomal protein S18 acetylase RimI-like enzyme